MSRFEGEFLTIESIPQEQPLLTHKDVIQLMLQGCAKSPTADRDLQTVHVTGSRAALLREGDTTAPQHRRAGDKPLPGTPSDTDFRCLVEDPVAAANAFLEGLGVLLRSRLSGIDQGLVPGSLPGLKAVLCAPLRGGAVGFEILPNDLGVKIRLNGPLADIVFLRATAPTYGATHNATVMRIGREGDVDFVAPLGDEVRSFCDAHRLTFLNPQGVAMDGLAAKIVSRSGLRFAQLPEGNLQGASISENLMPAAEFAAFVAEFLERKAVFDITDPASVSFVIERVLPRVQRLAEDSALNKDLRQTFSGLAKALTGQTEESRAPQPAREQLSEKALRKKYLADPKALLGEPEAFREFMARSFETSPERAAECAAQLMRAKKVRGAVLDAVAAAGGDAAEVVARAVRGYLDEFQRPEAVQLLNDVHKVLKPPLPAKLSASAMVRVLVAGLTGAPPSQTFPPPWLVVLRAFSAEMDGPTGEPLKALVLALCESRWQDASGCCDAFGKALKSVDFVGAMLCEAIKGAIWLRAADVGAPANPSALVALLGQTTLHPLGREKALAAASVLLEGVPDPWTSHAQLAALVLEGGKAGEKIESTAPPAVRQALETHGEVAARRSKAERRQAQRAALVAWFKAGDESKEPPQKKPQDLWPVLEMIREAFDGAAAEDLPKVARCAQKFLSNEELARLITPDLAGDKRQLLNDVLREYSGAATKRTGLSLFQGLILQLGQRVSGEISVELVQALDRLSQHKAHGELLLSLLRFLAPEGLGDARAPLSLNLAILWLKADMFDPRAQRAALSALQQAQGSGASELGVLRDLIAESGAALSAADHALMARATLGADVARVWQHLDAAAAGGAYSDTALRKHISATIDALLRRGSMDPAERQFFVERLKADVVWAKGWKEEQARWFPLMKLHQARAFVERNDLEKALNLVHTALEKTPWTPALQAIRVELLEYKVEVLGLMRSTAAYAAALEELCVFKPERLPELGPAYDTASEMASGTAQGVELSLKAMYARAMLLPESEQAKIRRVIEDATNQRSKTLVASLDQVALPPEQKPYWIALVNYHLGLVYAYSGRSMEAAQAFRTALTLRPEFATKDGVMELFALLPGQIGELERLLLANPSLDLYTCIVTARKRSQTPPLEKTAALDAFFAKTQHLRSLPCHRLSRTVVHLLLMHTREQGGVDLRVMPALTGLCERLRAEQERLPHDLEGSLNVVLFNLARRFADAALRLPGVDALAFVDEARRGLACASLSKVTPIETKACKAAFDDIVVVCREVLRGAMAAAPSDEKRLARLDLCVTEFRHPNVGLAPRPPNLTRKEQIQVDMFAWLLERETAEALFRRCANPTRTDLRRMVALVEMMPSRDVEQLLVREPYLAMLRFMCWSAARFPQQSESMRREIEVAKGFANRLKLKTEVVGKGKGGALARRQELTAALAPPGTALRTCLDLWISSDGSGDPNDLDKASKLRASLLERRA